MEVVIAILIGIYAICMVGYYKIFAKTLAANGDFVEILPKVTAMFFSTIWPVMMVYTLTVQALK